MLTAAGTGVKLLATFENGVIMPYLKGKLLYDIGDRFCMDAHIQR